VSSSFKTLSVALRADTGQYTAGLAKAGAETRAFGKEVSGLSKADPGRQSGWSKFAPIVKGGLVAAGVAVVAFGAASIKAAAQFDQRMSAIAAVTGATGSEMDKLRQKALQLGKDTAFSASDAARAIEELAKAGVSTADILNGAADATVNLAAAGEIDLPQAATIASNALNTFGLKGKDMAHVADEIAGAANASAIDVGEFGQSLAQAGAVAATIGLSLDDTAVAIAELGNAGIKGSDAGTSLKTMLQRLIPQTDQAKAALEKLGIITADGSNKFFDAQGNIKSFAQVQGILSTSLKGMSREQKLATLQTIFGSDAVRAAAVFTKEGAAGFDHMAKAMGKVSAADVAKKRMDNLKGSIEQLKGSLDTLLIIVGEKLTPAFRGAVDAVTGFLNKLIDPPKGFFDPLLNAGKMLKPFFTGLGDTIKNLGTILGTAASAAKPFAEAFGKLAALAIIGILDGIGQALSGITGFLAKNTALVHVLVTALAGMAAIKAFGAIANGALTAGAAIGSIIQKAGGAQGAIASIGSAAKTGALTLGIGAVVGALVSVTTGAQRARSEADKLFAAFGHFKPDNLDSIAKAQDRMVGAVARANAEYAKSRSLNPGNALKNLGQIVTGQTSDWDKYSGRLSAATDQQAKVAAASFRMKGAIGEVSTVLGISRDAAAQWIDKLNINPAKFSKFGDIAAKVGEARDAAKNATPATEALATSIETVSSDASTASDRVKAFSDAINGLVTPQLDAAGANTAFAKGLLDMTMTLATNKAGFVGNTQAVYDNQAAVQSQVKSAIDVANTQANATGSIKSGTDALKVSREAIINAGVAAGRTRPEMEALVNQYGLVPSNIDTLVSLDDGTAKQRAKDVQTLMAALDAAKANPTVEVNANNALTTIAGATTALGNYAKLNPTAKAMLDTAPAMGQEQAIASVLKMYAKSDPKAFAHLGIDPAKLSFSQLQQIGNNYRKSNPKTTASANNKPAVASLTQASNVAEIFNRKRPNPVLRATDRATPTVRGASSGVDAFGRKRATASLGVVDNATGPINAALRGIGIFARSSATATITTKHITLNQVISGAPIFGIRHGGFTGPSYARGGLAHVGYGTQYRWAEPATGGEALIPRLGDKGRAERVLNTAAGWYGKQVVPKAAFGHAGTGGGGVTVNNNVTVNGTGGLSEDQVMRAVERGGDRLVKVLQRRDRGNR
jgi:TP901 family phage tail tape measure protein